MGNSMCFRLFFLGGQNLCVFNEMEVKIGHILKKEKENIQKTWRSEKEDMKWNGKLDIK
mgnify:CR=1 FL=1